MKIPESVKVGAYTYKVVRGTRAQMGDKLGWCDNDHLTIFVRKYLRIEKAREVILHETLHACHYLAGRLETDRMTGEQFVEATVHGLLQVVRENPELLTYLSE